MADDNLCRHAESLLRTFSEPTPATQQAAAGSADAIADGYAHVLALDVCRMRLEREIARLAESGEPRVAGELRELSVLLRGVKQTSDPLRAPLSSARARAMLSGQLPR
jgi:hypothetical protein